MTEQLKKLAFLSVFHPFRGGIAQFNNELYHSLSDFCEIKAYNFSRQYPELLFPGKTQWVDENDPDPLINAQKTLDSINPFSYYKTARLINEENPSAVITSYWMPFFAPCLGKTLSGVKAKKIALLHNVIPHEKRFFDDAFNQYYLNQNDGFIVLSDTVKEQLLHYQPSAKYLQIPHPVYSHFGNLMDKSEAKKQLGIRSNKKVLLFFGFIRKYKGLDLLIDALADLQEDYTLLIAGENYGEASELEQKLQSSGIQGDKLCKRIQYIPDDHVKLYFSAAEACVLPYRSATQSGIAAIAKHFEVPMVVTPVGELPNEVTHLHNGIVCSEVSARAIKKGIIEVLKQQAVFSKNTRVDNAENSFANFASKLIKFI